MSANNRVSPSEDTSPPTAPTSPAPQTPEPQDEASSKAPDTNTPAPEPTDPQPTSSANLRNGRRSQDPWARSSSPYMRSGNPRHTPAADPFDVYAIVFKKPANGRGNRIGTVTPRDVECVEMAEGTTQLPIVQGHPPIGHHDDFFGVVPTKRRGLFSAWNSGDDDDEAGFYDQKFQLFEEGSLFGKVFTSAGMDPNDTLQNKENRQDALNGAKLLDKLTSIPLSKSWHVFSEVFFNLVFVTNVAVAIADIVIGPTFLYYKVTNLILGLIENLLSFTMWAISRHPKFKTSERKASLEKYQQYIENILGEVMIYPLTVLSILGFTTEKMYHVQTNVFGWVQLVLLVFDTICLIYGRIVRLYMLRKLIREITNILPAEEDDKPRNMWKTAGAILARSYYMFVGNFLVLAALACLFGIQANRDNLQTSNYRLTAASGTIMMCIILQPVLSLLLFVAANLHWILELLTQINYHIGQDKEHQEKLREKYGRTVVDSLCYARRKVPTSEKRLEVVSKVKPAKKLLYCLYEIPVLATLCIWQWILIITIYLFDGFEEDSANLICRVAFVVLFVLANPHVSLLMFLSNFMVAVLVVGVVVYPACVPLCCRKGQVRSQYKQLLSGKEEEEEQGNGFEEEKGHSNGSAGIEADALPTKTASVDPK